MSDQSGAGLSLSFKPNIARKLNVHDTAEPAVRQSLTHVGAQGFEIPANKSTTAKKQKLVIPAQPNSYRAGQSFRPSFVPDSAETEPTTEERFEAHAGDDGSVKSSIDYGLNVSTSKQHEKAGAAPPASVRGGRLREDAEAEQLRQDVANLPPEASLEAYEAMPVEAFGEALLRGMGWREGRAIGRKDRAEVEVVEMKRRAPGLGLGATPSTLVESAKKGGGRPDSRTLAHNGNSGRGGGSSAGHEAASTSSSEPRVGQEMSVVEGRHEGMRCVVLKLLPVESGRSARASVELVPSLQVVTLRLSELASPGAHKGERAAMADPARLGRGLEERARARDGRGEDREGHLDRDRGRSAGMREQTKAERPLETGTPSPRSGDDPWLFPNIRVKIVSKTLGAGRYYLKKATLVDVKTPTLCDIVLEGSHELVPDVTQSALETAVPSRPGANVLVVLGPHRGQAARLLERRTGDGLAVVQVHADMRVRKVYLDQVAEYVGPDAS